jgi:hypothetical protein
MRWRDRSSLRRKRIRTRRSSLLALAALLFAAGCGAGGDNGSPPSRSAIDRTVADQLASTSDSIADSLDDGDVCRAAGLADDLNSQVNSAIAAGKVPRRFQDDLQARATELVNTVNCPRPAATTTEEQDENGDENGNGKKKGHEKKKQETQTEPTVTIELPPEEP